MPQLSDSQLVVLTAACQRPDRCVFPITAKLKGNAAGNVLKSLLNKGLIKEVRAKRDESVWRTDDDRGRIALRATPAAFDALGIDPNEAVSENEGERDSDETEAAAASARRPKSKKRSRDGAVTTRADTKQSQLIDMLKRPEGATIDEIVNAFDWQPHTVRGAIAGALKKKLGLDVQSEKVEGRGRVYRIKS
jgi:hypothetical protein